MKGIKAKEYESLICNTETTNNDIRTFVYKHIPKSLFKYYYIDEEKSNFNDILLSIIKGKLQISNTKMYNDPFEFYYTTHSFDNSDNKFLYNHANETGKAILDITKILKENGKKDMIKNIENFNNLIGIEKLHNGEAMICCLSKRFDNILMWSHYANSHRGFCVEYSTDSNKFREYIYPVCYLDKLYDATHLLLGIGAFKKPNLLCKSKEWEYEDEWRLCLWKNELKKLFEEYNDEEKIIIDLGVKVKKIYLGVECSEKSEQAITSIAEKEKIDVIKLKKSNREYRLLI